MTETPKRERGTGSILRRKGTKNLTLQFYNSRGKQIRESAGTDDLQKAKKKLRKRLAEISENTYHDTGHITFEDLRAAFMADYQTNKRKSLRHDREGKPYLDKVDRLTSFFAGFHASQIGPDLIRQFIKDQQGRGLANGTINRSISALRRMFNLAVEDEKLRLVPRFPMLKETAPRKGFFERPEYEALYRALPDYLRLPLALGYYTAAREGEILSLKWEQIDFLAGTINLWAGETKNDGGRTIPIVPQLRAELLAQRAKRQTDCPFVCFRLDRKRRAVKIRGFRKAWYSSCMRTGLGTMEPAVDAVTGEPLYEQPRGLGKKPKPKMKYIGRIFHDLRRSGVRNLVRAGVPEKVAREISGHKTRSVFDRYNIVDESDVQQAGQKLAAFHENGVSSVSVSTETGQDEKLKVI